VATQLVNVLSRHTVHPAITMWGVLHTNQLTGAVVGWTVDTWSERGVIPSLPPKMHWVPKKDGKPCRVLLNVDYRSSPEDIDGSALEVFGEDIKIEPERAAFIRATLAIWEQEYLDKK
jgi:hypothetical protein